ncbi:MAG: hypothetical protein QM820_52795 [Minicystis sp.]
MATSKSKSTKPVASQPFTTRSPAAAYKHYLPLCKQLPDDSIKPCTMDVDIVRHNIDRGIAAIEPHLKVIKKKLPLCPITEVLELPAIGLALTFAADRIAVPASAKEIDERLVALRPMRDLTLRQLEIFADLGLAPVERVRSIRSGKGPIDSARDAISIAALFAELGGKVTGKHPFAPAYLKEMAEHGEWLLQQLKPERAISAPTAQDPASNVRDRMWTLLSARHDHLREAGVAVFGLKALDDNVPSLGARIISRPTEAAKADKTPAETDKAPAAAEETPAAKDKVPAAKDKAPATSTSPATPPS